MISAAKVCKENEAHKDSEGDCTNRPSRCMNRDYNRAVVSQGAKKSPHEGIAFPSCGNRLSHVWELHFPRVGCMGVYSKVMVPSTCIWPSVSGLSQKRSSEMRTSFSSPSLSMKKRRFFASFQCTSLALTLLPTFTPSI